ncbi:MAG TPA: TonB-dependent receptor [Caulobacteraceae bacterium]|jgi:TonB-dependent receptor
MRPNLKTVLLAGATLIAGASPRLALAQDVSGDQAAAKGAVDEVVVTGYRKSLSEARDLKKNDVIEKDSIVAEDIAKFPELNLAESLQRLPGVQITREAGEGREIALRGLGPDFSRVQLNGMEVLGNDDSAMDSRGQRSRDRAFDFNIFASELFSKVEVEKTYQASQNEGGMAGTVGLFTGKPFDYAPGDKGALGVKVGSNQYTKDVQLRAVALFSKNWDNKFGVLFSVAYAKRDTTEQGHDNYNYDVLSASDAAQLVKNGLNLSPLSAAQQAKFMDGGLYIPDGNRISSFNAKMERLGITGAVQWRPVDNLLLTLDALHGEFTTHRDELHLASRPLASGTASWAFDTPAGGPWPAIFQTASTINNLVWDKNNYVTNIDVTNSTFGTEHRRELNENRFNQVALTGKWDLNDRITIDGHVGYEKSTYDTPYDDKLYMRAKGNIIADYGADGQSANFSYPGSDLTNPANYAMDDFYYRAFHNGSELEEGVLNGRYKATDTWTLRAGVAYHRFQNDGANDYYDSNVNGTDAETRGTSVADIASVFSNSVGSWLSGNYDEAFKKYAEYHRLGPKPNGVGGAIQDIEQVYTVTEATLSEYVQADWDTHLFGLRFRGNIGLRGYQTHTRSQGWIQGDSYAYLGTADVKGSYSGVLPAMNSVLELTPDLLLRFAATQNLNRPTLSSLAAEGSAFQNNENCNINLPQSSTNDCQISASRGNPDLKPFTDTTLDFSAEYYFGKVGLLGASVFQKYIKNYITNETIGGNSYGSGIPFSQTGVPISAVPGATPSTVVDEFDMPVNDPRTHSLTGVELAAQSQFFFLPGPLKNLGAVLNYTYVSADQELTGISPTSYNVTLYYETNRWGVRGSLNHRSRYYTGYDPSPMSATTRGFEGTDYVDAAAFYNITPKLQVTFDAINLTNEKETQFWGQAHYLYNQTQSGTTFMAGVSYKF